MKRKRETFTQIMNSLACSHDVHSLFSDFLTLLICAFSHGAKEEQYLTTIGKYEKPEAYKLSEALGALVIEMTGDGTGMVDVLGQYFEEHLNFGKNGQFFTPQPVCDMMARILNPVKPLERIADPACGSGRMLMAMAKVNRFARFYGADNDINCARMTTINLFLNNLFGEVACMDTLTQQYRCGWVIEPTIKGIPRIRQISERESYVKLRLPEELTKASIELPKINNPVELIYTKQPEQALLFEF